MFLVNPLTERHDLGLMPHGLIVNSFDSDEETFPDVEEETKTRRLRLGRKSSTRRQMSGSTAAERGGISSDDDDDIAPVRIQDFLVAPRWRRRIHAQLLRRAGKRLQELHVVDSNNQWISSRDILKDGLERNPAPSPQTLLLS